MSTVRDVLGAKGTAVLTVTPDTPVMRVAQRMRRENVGAFVVSGDGRHLEGMITERDVVFGLARHGPEFVHMSAAALMSRAVETCTADDSVRSVMATMTRARVRHVPVLEHHELCGIVSIGDLIKNYVDETELEARVLRDIYLAHRTG
jgi:CBS domain-containing protein